MAKKLSIFIIDDSKEDRILLVENLYTLEEKKKYDFDITQVNSVSKALEIFSSTNFDVVFMDFMMDDGDGLQLLLDLTEKQKQESSIIFLTGQGSSIVKEDSLLVGAKTYLDKSEMSIETIDEAIKKAIK